MVKGTASVHIDRPADEVFADVAEAENNPRWHAHVLETRWLDDGPMRRLARVMDEAATTLDRT